MFKRRHNIHYNNPYYAECQHAEHRYAKCQHAECRGAI
jgi:hypothetical protein